MIRQRNFGILQSASIIRLLNCSKLQNARWSDYSLWEIAERVDDQTTELWYIAERVDGQTTELWDIAEHVDDQTT